MAARIVVTFKCGETGCGNYVPDTMVIEDWANVAEAFAKSRRQIERVGWVLCDADCRLVCAECMRRSQERKAELPEEEEEEEEELERTFNDWCNCGSCREARGEPDDSELDELF